MLPIDVLLDLFTWMDVTRNIFTFIPLMFAIVYITKQSQDDVWMEQRFAHFVSILFILWIVASILSPFLIMSFLYPTMTWEIGTQIISSSLIGVFMAIVIVLVLEIAQYRGFFRKKIGTG